MTAKQSTKDRATVAAMESTQIDAAIQTMREGQETADKAWKVGHHELGYVIAKAPTRMKARMRFPTAYSGDAESWMTLRALRQPQYDHLTEDEAQNQWETDMAAEFGPDWGEA